ncbi:hypothetical protein D3C79_1082330 [compost metagenome]
MQLAEHYGLTGGKRVRRFLQLNDRVDQNFEHPPDHQRKEEQQQRAEPKGKQRGFIGLFQRLVNHIA